MLRRVLVLNFTYEPINICSLRRAVVLILGEKAEIIEEGEGLIRSEKICLAQPFVIRLKYYVKVPRGRRRRISRKAILARDRFRCQYCGSTRHLTLDHVIPRSRGGSTTWDNLVTSCAPCNTDKGDNLPSEVGLTPRNRPRRPSPVEFLVTSAREVPASWEPYLANGEGLPRAGIA